MVMLLVKRGAKPNLQNKQQKTVRYGAAWSDGGGDVAAAVVRTHCVCWIVVARSCYHRVI